MNRRHLAVTRSIIIFFLLSSLSCSSKKNKTVFDSPAGYNFSNPVIIHLRNDLDEISGLSYYAKDTSLFAVADELGILYKISLKKPVKISSWKFSGEGDFEDILLIDSTFYALQSNGDLKAFRISNHKLQYDDECRLPIDIGSEFETIYYDADNEKIVLICKDCETDSHRIISAYSFDLTDQTFSKKPWYQIDGKRVSKMIDEKKVKFKPSAAAIHPLTKDLYIVSAVARTLVITDTQGNIKTVYRLDPKFFKQPEGLTFGPDGTLYISNEAAEEGSGNVLIFKYKQPVNETM